MRNGDRPFLARKLTFVFRSPQTNYEVHSGAPPIGSSIWPAYQESRKILVQRHLVSRSTLRIFRSEAAAQWRSATNAA